MQPVTNGAVTGRVEVVHQGRRLISLAGELHGGEGLAATATAVFAITTHRQADGMRSGPRSCRLNRAALLDLGDPEEGRTRRPGPRVAAETEFG